MPQDNKKQGIPMNFRGYEDFRDGLLGGKLLGVPFFVGAVSAWVVLTLFVGFIIGREGMVNKTPVLLTFAPIVFLLPLWLVKKAGGLVTRPLKQAEPFLIVTSIVGTVLLIMLVIAIKSGVDVHFW